MTARRPSLLVHATNITGLGAANLVDSLLGPLCETLLRPTIVFIPAVGPVSRFAFSGEPVRIVRFRRRLPRAISRVAECLWPQRYFAGSDATLVLGDLPLRNSRRQVVLVHQPNLIKPHVDPLTSRAVTFKISRWLFARNLRFVSKVIVQTAVMKEQLEASYPVIRGRVVLIPQPAPTWALKQGPRQTRTAGALSLFYPAAGYPHKHHKLFQEMNRLPHDPAILRNVVVTLTAVEYRLLRGISWIRNVGRLDPSRCLAMYGVTDAVFFPSLAESSPLPLAEAMTLGLPVVCADLPYARWMCGGEAIYFDPRSADSAWDAIRTLHARLSSGWKPDWTTALAKFPADWDAVARQFVCVIDAAE